MRFLIGLLISFPAFSQDFYVDNKSGKTLTKVEAARLLLTKPQSAVVKCYPVELSEKLSLRKKKVKK